MAMTKLRVYSLWSNLQNGCEKPAMKILFLDCYISPDAQFSWHYEYSIHLAQGSFLFKILVKYLYK